MNLTLYKSNRASVRFVKHTNEKYGRAENMTLGDKTHTQQQFSVLKPMQSAILSHRKFTDYLSVTNK